MFRSCEAVFQSRGKCWTDRRLYRSDDTELQNAPARAPSRGRSGRRRRLKCSYVFGLQFPVQTLPRFQRLTNCIVVNRPTARAEWIMPFTLNSSAFQANQPIPPKYTCVGSDVSVPLTWTNAPTGTKSFAL